MLTYMGVFFIIFSLAKMLDWNGFVEAFSNYDIISKKVRFYGWLYPALEFSLGLFYLTNNFIFSSAIVTSFIMGFGSIGITKNLLSKNKVKCACLGTKIKVPLTKVTLLENLIMFFMALSIIFFFFFEPGVEPGSSRWQRDILTTILPARKLFLTYFYIKILIW